jgi:hypothetical protein
LLPRLDPWQVMFFCHLHTAMPEQGRDLIGAPRPSPYAGASRSTSFQSVTHDYAAPEPNLIGTPASRSSTAKVSRNMWEWQRLGVPSGLRMLASLKSRARARVHPRLQVAGSPCPLQKEIARVRAGKGTEQLVQRWRQRNVDRHSRLGPVKKYISIFGDAVPLQVTASFIARPDQRMSKTRARRRLRRCS